MSNSRVQRQDQPASAQPRRQPPCQRRPYRVVIVRMRAHQPTIEYVRRRTAEGKSKPEIIRCLKRFVAREIFGYLCRDPKPTRPEQIAA